MELRHFLSLDSLSRDELHALLEAADAAGADPSAWGDRLAGRRIVLLFEKPSTRTRVSFEAAVVSLGAHPIVLRSEELQLGRGETIEDTGRVLSRYADAIVVRTFGQDRLERLADAATVPVINGLSDSEHPCQALADLLTIRQERGELAGTRVTYVGDGNNVAHSLMMGAALTGMHVRVASPPGFAPFPRVVEATSATASETGGSVRVLEDPVEGAAGAHVLYTDVWTSMGREDERSERARAFEGYRLDDRLISVADPGCIVMHCLPAHRGEEIAAAAIDGPRSVVWDQAENRLHAQRALLVWLLT